MRVDIAYRLNRSEMWTVAHTDQEVTDARLAMTRHGYGQFLFQLESGKPNVFTYCEGQLISGDHFDVIRR